MVGQVCHRGSLDKNRQTRRSTLDKLLQWLGGGLYLLNKIFFSIAERSEWRGNTAAARKWRIASWIVYLAGLGPWVVIFVRWHNWIAASVEASGVPAMVLGLVTAITTGESKKVPRWLDLLAGVCIVLGFGVSLYDFGGLTTINQWLEIGLVVGFLVGTYLLAKKRSSGYLWFVLMHISAGSLMWVQGYPWLLAQQVVSLGFIVDAYRVSQRKK